MWFLVNSSSGQLAAIRWRSKLGRPSKIPSLGEVDPTGTYCPMPDDWLNRKYGKDIVFLSESYTVVQLLDHPLNHVIKERSVGSFKYL